MFILAGIKSIIFWSAIAYLGTLILGVLVYNLKDMTKLGIACIFAYASFILIPVTFLIYPTLVGCPLLFMMLITMED